LYGDSIGAIAPLKDLYKFQVYSLANYINKTFNNVIPREIILKEPSAELRDNQKDEDDIPPYHILDKILYYHLEKKFSFKQIKNKLKEENIDITKSLYLDIIKRIYINEYKRYQTPIGFKISEFSFTKERRVPIINSFYKDLYNLYKSMSDA
jgi:NAD+ synthase (glutamine-hydrolysing)